MSTFRAIHYLPRSANLVDSSKLDENGRKLTAPEHCDSGFMTLLTTFGYPGLQVEIEKTREWNIQPFDYRRREVPRIFEEIYLEKDGNEEYFVFKP